MRFHRFPRRIIFLLYFFAVIVLAGCDLPGTEEDPAKMDVTQAYQTLDAGLTQVNQMQVQRIG